MTSATPQELRVRATAYLRENIECTMGGPFLLRYKGVSLSANSLDELLNDLLIAMETHK